MPLIVKLAILVALIYLGFEFWSYTQDAKAELYENDRVISTSQLDENYTGEDRINSIKKVVK